MTPDRAKEIQHAAAQWPYCGNTAKFMMPDERDEIDRLWLQASDINGGPLQVDILTFSNFAELYVWAGY